MCEDFISLFIFEEVCDELHYIIVPAEPQDQLKFGLLTGISWNTAGFYLFIYFVLYIFRLPGSSYVLCDLIHPHQTFLTELYSLIHSFFHFMKQIICFIFLRKLRYITSFVACYLNNYVTCRPTVH